MPHNETVYGDISKSILGGARQSLDEQVVADQLMNVKNSVDLIVDNAHAINAEVGLVVEILKLAGIDSGVVHQVKDRLLEEEHLPQGCFTHVVKDYKTIKSSRGTTQPNSERDNKTKSSKSKYSKSSSVSILETPPLPPPHQQCVYVDLRKQNQITLYGWFRARIKNWKHIARQWYS